MPLLTTDAKQAKAPHGGRFLKKEDLEHLDKHSHTVGALVHGTAPERKALAEVLSPAGVRAISTLARLAFEHDQVPEELVSPMLTLTKRHGSIKPKRDILTGGSFTTHLSSIWEFLKKMYATVSKYTSVVAGVANEADRINSSVTRARELMSDARSEEPVPSGRAIVLTAAQRRKKAAAERRRRLGMK